MLALADVLRALKHHVFEEVREAGAAFFFVARADVVGDGDGISGRAVVLGKDHAQPVVELVLFEREC